MSKNGFKTFAQLSKAKTAFKREKVEVEEWGTSVYVRQLSGREQQKVADLGKGRDTAEWSIEDTSKFLAMAVEDAEGGSPDHEWLVDQPFAVLQRLADEVLEINGMTEAAKAALEKN